MHMKHIWLLVITVTFSSALSGCRGDADEEITSSEPPRREIKFEGTIDPTYVGTWKDVKGDLRYNFSKEGTYTNKGTVSTPAGPQPVDLSGDWKVNGTLLILKDSKGETYDYDAKISGSELTLKTKGQKKFEFKYKKE